MLASAGFILFITLKTAFLTQHHLILHLKNPHISTDSQGLFRFSGQVITKVIGRTALIRIWATGMQAHMKRENHKRTHVSSALTAAISKFCTRVLNKRPANYSRVEFRLWLQLATSRLNCENIARTGLMSGTDVWLTDPSTRCILNVHCICRKQSAQITIMNDEKVTWCKRGRHSLDFSIADMERQS